MKESEIIETLNGFTNTLACYGNYSYKMKVYSCDISELYHLLIVNEGNTQNVIAEIKELKKWNPKDAETYNKMDSLFRWEAVENGRQLICFEVGMPTAEDGIKTVFMLLNIKEANGQKGRYVGLMFDRNYLDS